MPKIVDMTRDGEGPPPRASALLYNACFLSMCAMECLRPFMQEDDDGSSTNGDGVVVLLPPLIEDPLGRAHAVVRRWDDGAVTRGVDVRVVVFHLLRMAVDAISAVGDRRRFRRGKK
jgi:hypothetical protein